MTGAVTTRVAVVSALVMGVALAAGACSGSSSSASRQSDPTLRILVSAPVTTAPWIARAETQGAQLAADQVNARGGVLLHSKRHRLTVEVEDSAGSPQRAAATARRAVDEHAVALITDGTGAAALADVTGAAALPTFVVFDGGASVVDPQKRPTVFRLAPADKYMTMRLADYLAQRRPKIAVIADDTGYGVDGLASLRAAFTRDQIPVVSSRTVPSAAGDVTTEVLAARRAGATQVVVWAAAGVVAAAVDAARSARWPVPVWAGPTGEDPLVRQRLAAHPAWLSGVGFVSFRITAEVGAAPFASYRQAYEKAFGHQRVGVQQDGKQVVQPPDWSMFSYDAVNLVAAALPKAGAAGRPLLDTLAGNVVVTGANGDERGYSESSREGVSPDDMYLALFDGFVFRPVTDDLLSRNLPTVPQTE